MKIFIIFILFLSASVYSSGRNADTSQVNNKIPPVEYKLKNGKSFIVLQSPESVYLYDVYIIGVGFPDSKDTILFDEIEQIDTVIIADINNDGFEEMYIFTRGFSPGAYDHVFGITSDNDKSYKEVEFRLLKQDDIKEGGVFEGYNGKDVYSIKNNTLERTFPVHQQGDSYQNPTSYKTIYYTIEKVGSKYFYKIKE